MVMMLWSFTLKEMLMEGIPAEQKARYRPPSFLASIAHSLPSLQPLLPPSLPCLPPSIPHPPLPSCPSLLNLLRSSELALPILQVHSRSISSPLNAPFAGRGPHVPSAAAHLRRHAHCHLRLRHCENRQVETLSFLQGVRLGRRRGVKLDGGGREEGASQGLVGGVESSS